MFFEQSGGQGFTIDFTKKTCFQYSYINYPSDGVFYLYCLGLLNTFSDNCGSYTLQYCPFDLSASAITSSSFMTSVFINLIMSLTICDNLLLMENVGSLRSRNF